MKLSSFITGQHVPAVCLHDLQIFGYTFTAQNAPRSRGNSTGRDWAPPRLWHFYNNGWDFQRGNELSKSASSSVWIGLPTSGVIFFKASRSELVTKVFAFFFNSPFTSAFSITQAWSNTVLWQAARAKLQHCSCYNPSLSVAHFPFSWRSQEDY